MAEIKQNQEEKDNKFDLVYIWNRWIDFCKKPIAYDLAFAFTLSLISYLIGALGGYFIVGFNEPASHTFGVLIMFLSFLAVAYVKGKMDNNIFWNLDMVYFIRR